MSESSSPLAPAGTPAPSRRSRARLGFAVAAMAAAGLLAASTRVSLTGHWQGLFLLRGKEGVRLELKDDLFLGDGPRLLWGVSFARVRRLVAGRGAGEPGATRLDLDFDEAEGNGIIRNLLGDGTEVVTLFGRYEDSEGRTPRGLFVGGALPDIAADDHLQNESGMAYRDARGWHHVWCNVNEGVYDTVQGVMIYPSSWRFVGSRVLVRERERLVLASTHEIELSGTTIRMERFAYFRAGEPWFKLGVHLVNAGDQVARFAFLYGDEPWVGDFGSSAGNVGWTARGIVDREGFVETGEDGYAGVYDVDSRTANFLAWLGDEKPIAVFFSNRPAPPRTRDAPLSSNEIFLGAEWKVSSLPPGGSWSLLLAIGLAEVDPVAGPRLPRAFRL